MLPIAAAAIADPADEDTLHPEDDVRLPDDATMIVSASAAAAALADGHGAGADADAAPSPAPASGDSASLARLIVAGLVIVALSATIVLLVLDALPR